MEQDNSGPPTASNGPSARQQDSRDRTYVSRDDVIAAFATAPDLDPEHFRTNTDAAIDQDPSNRSW